VRAVLIVNPKATSTTPGGRDVLAHALASQVKLEVVETDYRGHAMAMAVAAARDGIDLVVAHGGDGTVNEVVNGLLADSDGDPASLGHAPMLGVVPGGSANVFARALGVSYDPVEATHHLLHAIEDGRTRQVGLGLADGHWFTFNAGLGWDADVVASVAKRRGKQTSGSPITFGPRTAGRSSPCESLAKNRSRCSRPLSPTPTRGVTSASARYI
jgi:diacylglycerol kinase family enzyme